MKKSMLSLAIALLPVLAHAWGQEGHSIVAELAQRQLSPAARQATQDLMGPGVSLASLSTWADTVAHSTRQDTKGWHYVDIARLLSNYRRERDCIYRQKDQPDTPDTCVIQAIEQNTAVLANTSASEQERREALKFLVHFVADIHQPLHTVDEEAGGNGVQVSFLVQPGNPGRTGLSNLHAVWETGIFRAQYYTWGEHLDVLTAKWFDGTQMRPLTDDCATATSRPTCWALEAHTIMQKPGYWVPSGAALDANYLALVAPDRDLQLLRAGARLAQLLNQVLDH